MIYSKFEKLLYTSLILLAVFIFGIQIGIIQGKELQKQEFTYDYRISN